MDNKNEKTFADLFSSSSLESDNSNVEIEDESEELSSDKVKNITFDDLFNNTSDVISDEVVVTDFNEVKEVENAFVGDNSSNEPESMLDNSFMDFKDEEKEFDNIIEQNNEGNIDTNNSLDINLDENDTSDMKEEESNPFFDIDAVEEKNEDVNNGTDSSALENKVTENLVDDNLSSNPLFNDNDIFASINDNEKNDMQIDNPFLNGDINTELNNSGESINKLALEAKEKKNISEEVNNSSISPFFDNSGSIDLNSNGLDTVFDNISVDETKNINSKLNKIDLNGTKNFNVKLVKKKISLLQFITGVISYAFFIFLVLVLVTLLAYVLDIKIRAAKGDYSAPKFNAYVVLTGSMLPEIKVKDVVVTKKIETNELEVGDIITFASSDSRFLGTIITHRIIKKNQDKDGKITFQTRGDNNNVADSALVQPNNIYGKVILKIPKLGYLQDFLATQGGWIIVILLPCVTVISYDIVKLSKSLKRRKNKINVIK